MADLDILSIGFKAERQNSEVCDIYNSFVLFENSIRSYGTHRTPQELCTRFWYKSFYLYSSH